jgi:hypothetical protein
LPTSPSSLRRLSFVFVVAVASGAVWLACWQAAQSVLVFTQLETGITLIYIPAGIRLVILLISGIGGALGIALAFPLALLQVYPDATWQEALAYSAIAGLVPYATVFTVCRAARVSRDLGTLRSFHLPLLSAAVSVIGALAYTGALTAYGRLDRSMLLKNVTAMAVGDFLGCFAVVVLVRLVITSRKQR